MLNKQKDLGQYFTSELIADFMAELVIEDTTKEVLDPAVGQGRFIFSARKHNPNLRFTAFDVDPEMIYNCKSSIDNSTHYILHDYLTYFSDCKYDAIICNPPYNKFQKIPNRSVYINTFFSKYGIKLSGYSNLCVYFIIKSLSELQPTGKCVYIVPYEFLNAGYGTIIKQYMLKDRKLKTIYKFDNTLNIFDDSITTSCILLFDSAEHETVDLVSIDSIEQFINHDFSNTKIYSFDELDPSQKWSQYFNTDSHSDRDRLKPFSAFAKVKRGIATGNNEFFAVSEQQARRLALTDDVLVKCVCKSADVKKIIFTDEDFSALKAAGKKVYLFDGTQASTHSEYDYIEFGEKNGVNKGFLTSHRKPWYLLENRSAAPIWVSVFNRNGIKFIRNKTNAKSLTTFHGIFMNEGFESYADILFCYLLTPLSQRILKENKREYGGGLDKFEPNDLNNSFIFDLTQLSDAAKGSILDIYNKLERASSDQSINELIKALEHIFHSHMEPSPSSNKIGPDQKPFPQQLKKKTYTAH